MPACRPLRGPVTTTFALFVALANLPPSARAADDLAARRALAQAKLLGQQGEIDAALDRCEESIPIASAESAIAIALTIARQASDELNAMQQQRIQGWIDEALRASPDDPAVLVLAADLKDLQGDYDEVVRIYRGLLGGKKLTDTQRATVLNNLAYLVALDEHDGDAALPLIEEAIQLAGPHSDLLDTRGTVRLAQGKPWQAIRDFKRAISASASPIKVFHLADALLLWDDDYRAEATFRTAIEMGLKPRDVPPLERGNFQAMRDRFQSGPGE